MEGLFQFSRRESESVIAADYGFLPIYAVSHATLLVNSPGDTDPERREWQLGIHEPRVSNLELEGANLHQTSKPRLKSNPGDTLTTTHKIGYMLL